MSFKREGDDQSQLNILKKRRVADLLSNFIPEDEATLLKNGRYTCLVCSHRPVFDTVDMLTVHRKGKRHLEGMKWFYGKKTELRHEIDKRRHQEYVKTENHQQEPASASPLLAQTRHITHHALLKATPYSSCHKKRTRPDDPSADGGSGFSSPHINDRHLPQSHAAHTVGAKGTGATCPSLSCSENTPASPTPPQENRKKETKKKGLKSTGHTESEPLTEQRRRELEHYLRLKSSGWLQDKSGTWVKDENVEFDSDEDEPAPLGPSSESAEGTQ